MKKKIISIVLAIVLTFGCLVVTPVHADIHGFSDYVSPYEDFYIFPVADVNDATIVRGTSRDLKFRCLSDSSIGYEHFYCVAIYRGSMEQFAETVDQGKDPEVMDFFYENSQDITERTEYQMSVKWKADSRYSVGDYCLVCYLLNAETNKIDDRRDLYWTDLHVVKEKRPATDMSLWAMTDYGWDEIEDESIYEIKQWPRSLYLIAEPEPYPSTDKLNCSVYASPSHVVSGKGVSLGYPVLSLRMDGIARVSVASGPATKSFWLKLGDFDETTDLKIYHEKSTLCVGEEDLCEIRAKQNYNMLPAAGIWTSSDPSVATVGTRGEVKALKPGKVQITAVSANFKETVEYTVQYHELPEGTPVSTRTATQPKQAVGHCSICGKDDAVNVYEPAVFTDTVPTAWYAAHVDKVYDLGLMNGTGEHTFAPNANVNRAMAATVLYRIAGEPEVEGDIPFNDVPENKYYTNAVIWAEKHGVVAGFPDGTFRPNDNITREQLATILYRYAGAQGKVKEADADLSAFPDAAKVHAYALDAMAWAVGAELINGVGSGGKSYLQPANNATRAQFATIISRYMESVDPLTPVQPEPVPAKAYLGSRLGDGNSEPGTMVRVTSVEELEQFQASGREPVFDVDFSGYDEAFFREKALLFVVARVTGSAPGITLASVNETDDRIEVELTWPDEPPSPDMREWILLFEVGRNTPEKEIWVNSEKLVSPPDKTE